MSACADVGVGGMEARARVVARMDVWPSHCAIKYAVVCKHGFLLGHKRGGFDGLDGT